MKRTVIAATVAVLVMATAVVGASASARTNTIPVPPPYNVVSLNAFLFFNDTGGFSRAIPENALLWNTIIGEGWAGLSSDATLIRVVVTGQPASYAPKRAVHLVVREGRPLQAGGFRWGAVLQSRTGQLSGFTSGGRTTVAFWIPDSGCTPLQVTATLVGQAPRSVMTRVIPFACGE
jgi:hypothetical protein